MLFFINKKFLKHVTRNTYNTYNTYKTIKGEKIMNNNINNNNNNNNNNRNLHNNTIASTRENERRAREAAEREEERARRLSAIQPVDIVGTMDEVVNHVAIVSRDEEGNPVGLNSGELYQKPVIINGVPTTVGGDSAEAVDATIEEINNGRAGDGLYHRMVLINGYPCDCVGRTPEELEADIAAAEDYAQAHINGNLSRDLDVAEQLCDAGYRQEDLEQITLGNKRYLLSYEGRYIMDLNGSTQVSLEDIQATLGREDIKTLLLERLAAEHR